MLSGLLALQQLSSGIGLTTVRVSSVPASHRSRRMAPLGCKSPVLQASPAPTSENSGLTQPHQYDFAFTWPSPNSRAALQLVTGGHCGAPRVRHT